MGHPAPLVPLRASIAAWLAPAVIAAMLFFWWSVLSPITPAPYWNNYLTWTSDGLQYGLPLAAGGAAWTARQARPLRHEWKLGSRGALRILWAHLWPLFAAVGTGILLTIVSEIIHDGLPAPTWPNLFILLTFAAMAMTAIGAGWLLGTLLPAPVAVPIAIFGILQWAVFPLTDGSNTSWRNMTGYAVFMCCEFVNNIPDPRAIFAPVIIGVALGLIAILSVRYEVIYWASAAVPLLAISIFAAHALAVGTSATGGQLRSAADLDCNHDTSLTVCLLPETRMTEGESIVSVLASGYQSAKELGVTLPSRVSETTSETVDPTSTTTVDFTGDTHPDRLLATYSSAIYQTITCRPASVPSQLPATIVVPYSLALVMGATPEGALPSIAISLSGEGANSSETELSSAQLIDALNVKSKSDALANVNTWLELQRDC